MKRGYKYVTSEKDIEQELKKYGEKDIIGVDIETEGINPLDPYNGNIRLVQIAAEKEDVLVIDWRAISQKGKNMIKELLEGEAVKVFHNAKFDMKFLHKAGIFIERPIFDTFLAAGVLLSGLEGEKLGLADVVKKFLNRKLPKEQQKSDWSVESLSEKQLEYAAIDAKILLRLRKKLIEKLEEDKLIETAKLEFETLPAIVEMELSGVRADKYKLLELKHELEQKKDEKLRKLNSYFKKGINPNSSKQVIEALAEIGVIIQSTKYEELSEIAEEHEVIQALIEYKDVTKKLQFAEKIPKNISDKTHRVHSKYAQLGAGTGRLSCTDFNLQQVPHEDEFRSCFIPEARNVFVISDYSQIQIRIAAEVSGDKEMIRAYRNGEDIHTLTASLISGKAEHEITKDMRTAAKALNFGMLFGMGAKGLVKYSWSSYGIRMTETEAAEFIGKFFQKYSGLKQWQRNIQNKSTNETRTLGGRRRMFSGTPKYTQVVNTPIQGTEADIIKKALGVLFEALKDTGGKIVACIHDEIIVECPKEHASEVSEILTVVMRESGAYFLKAVPVVAESVITESWSA